MSRHESSAERPGLEEIEHDLAGTRARLNVTIDALRQKLSPGKIADRAISRAQESGGAQFGRNLVSTVRGHPVPVALLGIELGWLMLSERRGRGAGIRRLPIPSRPGALI